METMEHELKFLSMLGYKLKSIPTNETRWVILDENEKEVGFIQRKKLVNKNNKKGIAAEYGYVTEIDSDTISYYGTRAIDDKNGMHSYIFDIKRGNDKDHVEMNCGMFPNITIWSQEYGNMSFYISHDGLFANFKSKTENFNMEEVIKFKAYKSKGKKDDYGEEYTYQIRYCDKGIELTDNSKGRTTREISAKYHPHYQNPNEIVIEEKAWENGELTTNRNDTYVGTVEEVTEKQQMGIYAFNHFRYLLNSILPFKQEVMNAMLSRTPYIVEQKIELFLPDIIEQLKENPCLDCRSKGACDMLGIPEDNCISLWNHNQLTKGL